MTRILSHMWLWSAFSFCRSRWKRRKGTIKANILWFPVTPKLHPFVEPHVADQLVEHNALGTVWFGNISTVMNFLFLWVGQGKDGRVSSFTRSCSTSSETTNQGLFPQDNLPWSNFPWPSIPSNVLLVICSSASSGDFFSVVCCGLLVGSSTSISWSSSTSELASDDGGGDDGELGAAHGRTKCPAAAAAAAATWCTKPVAASPAACAARMFICERWAAMRWSRPITAVLGFCCWFRFGILSSLFPCWLSLPCWIFALFAGGPALDSFSKISAMENGVRGLLGFLGGWTCTMASLLRGAYLSGPPLEAALFSTCMCLFAGWIAAEICCCTGDGAAETKLPLKDAATSAGWWGRCPGIGRHGEWGRATTAVCGTASPATTWPPWAVDIIIFSLSSLHTPRNFKRVLITLSLHNPEMRTDTNWPFFSRCPDLIFFKGQFPVLFSSSKSNVVQALRCHRNLWRKFSAQCVAFSLHENCFPSSELSGVRCLPMYVQKLFARCLQPTLRNLRIVLQVASRRSFSHWLVVSPVLLQFRRHENTARVQRSGPPVKLAHCARYKYCQLVKIAAIPRWRFH